MVSSHRPSTQVKKQGVTYFSSAGNSGLRSYESDFRASTVSVLGPGAGPAQNFSSPSDSARYLQPIYIPSGARLSPPFQWDQSSYSASGVGAESDLDVYLMDPQGNIVALGSSNNIVSGEPSEVFGFFNNTDNATFYLLIRKFSGPDPAHLNTSSMAMPCSI